MDKIEALPPIKVRINWKILLKSIFFFLISLILWLILIVSAMNILIYYIKSIWINGWLHPETLKFAIYLIIGTYFFLILDKKKVYDAFNIKKDIPYITIEQIKKKESKKK